MAAILYRLQCVDKKVPSYPLLKYRKDVRLYCLSKYNMKTDFYFVCAQVATVRLAKFQHDLYYMKDKICRNSAPIEYLYVFIRKIIIW